MKIRSLLPPAWLGLCVAAMVALRLLAPKPVLLRSPYRYIGGLLILAGLVFSMWADHLFRRAGTTVKPFERPSRLVVHGPFRLSRNPMYLGMIVALAGATMMLGALAPWAALPIFVLVVDRCFIPAEEQAMEETFGDEYRQYTRRVRRWL